MASVVPGFEYDIFISYRQKDNRHDGWVTEFVENLMGELESTFKEEVSVYFDVNPHDGLLETHDVDESLKNKLKCLIFIPIISRTYCDTKAFAWEHEFKAFVEQASQDKFGLKVRVPNGNVTSRVLPVRIYDLEASDLDLYESVLGGPLRGIDFIYSEPGVNRPLRANEENPHNNLNHTTYLNQLNKAANTIKEIISAIKQSGQETNLQLGQETNFQPGQETDRQPGQTTDKRPGKTAGEKPVKHKGRLPKIIAGSVIALLLIAAGVIFIPKLFKSADNIEKSIAVLPFRNDSADQENSAFINGLMDKTLSNLQMIKGLRVISRTSVEKYRDHDKSIPEIAKELGVNYIVEGSGQRIGNNYSLTVQLIKADKKEDHLWAESYEQEIEEADGIFTVQSKIAETIAKELEVNLTTEEKQLIDKIPTKNLTALDFYQTGIEEFRKYQADIYDLGALDRAEDLLDKALQHDPAFAEAYLGLAQVYSARHAADQSKNYLDSVLVLVNTALKYDPDLAEAYVWRGGYYSQNGYAEKALEEYDKALDINPSLWQAYGSKALIYAGTDPLEAIKNMHKALSVTRGPELPDILNNMGLAYSWAGFPDVAKKYAVEKLSIDNDSVSYIARLGAIEYNTGNLEESVNYFKKVIKSDPRNLTLLYNIGFTSSIIGNYEEAQVYIDRWLENLNQTLVASFRVNGMHRVGYIYWENGRYDEANYYFDLQMEASTYMINSNQGIAAYYDRAGVYAFRGEKEKAYEDLRIYNQLPAIPAYMMTLIKYDPLFDSIRDEPEFQQILRDNEVKFAAMHESIRQWREENNML